MKKSCEKYWIIECQMELPKVFGPIAMHSLCDQIDVESSYSLVRA